MEPIDLKRVRTVPLQARKNKVAWEQFARPPQPGCTFAEFLASLPHILAGQDFREIVRAVVTARQNQRPVIVGLGAHVIKCGLSPVIIDLMQRGVVTGVALNGAGAIHDMELALIGETSEDVAAGLKDGTFGMVRETGEILNQAINRVLEQPERGMGALLAEQLTTVAAPHQELSILAAGRRLNIPVTVHVAIGTDIIHMHPSANGAATGQASLNDLRLLAGVVAHLSGGVYLNIGSAVLLPEVFLKAFTLAQNQGADLHDFVTVNMDMLPHYRPMENVVRRPSQLGRAGYSLIGRHEIMVPLLAQAVVNALTDTPAEASKAGEQGKIVGWDELLQKRRQWRNAGRTVVWTNGCFDLLHAGHVHSLQSARKLGDVLVVGLNSDDSVRRIKGPERPILPARERALMLAALACVDHVVIFEETTPENALARLQPDIHCKGAEYAPPNGKPVPERGVVASYGGRIEYLPLVAGLSTTDLVRRIRGM
ncbi:MAG TPA: adenylyltransferase/cytidyltransferase family protein [Gemmataceae bacterium]|nr:adenylyltransferase/cytidyltransferase family protein [Gemmataceae bacterium]